MIPSQILIIGGGLAGLFCALKLAPHPVTVVMGPPLGEGAASSWAQGGIAAALSAQDTPLLHAQDTIAAGYELVDPKVALGMAQEAQARIEDLLAYGVPFDQDAQGHLIQSREAAHSLHRIARVRGDMAGKAIMAALRDVVERTPSITLAQGFMAHSLAMDDGDVVGVRAYDAQGQDIVFHAPAVVLATGGIGHLYALTTNPPESCALGLAMAARAGARIADAEFVQFHPTAIDVGRDPAPLATEALRGEGASLVNKDGMRFMTLLHPEGDLAPRDVVARGVFQEILDGRGAFLDARMIGATFPTAFSSVFAACKEAGLDPRHDLIPVAPAEHYHMGGVFTDAQGRTNLPGLWAAGEVACTGVHGANRLASNSLLEAAVFATRVAQDILSTKKSWRGALSAPLLPSAPQLTAQDEQHDAPLISALRALNTRYVGVIRDGKELELARQEILALASQARTIKVKSMMLSSLLIVSAALQRKESRGAHFRADFPAMDPSQAHRAFQDIHMLNEIVPPSSQFWNDICP